MSVTTNVRAIIEVMGRLAGLQFRVENYLYLPVSQMAIVEAGVITATRNRCFPPDAEQKFVEISDQHMGTASQVNEVIYPASLMIKQMTARCSALRLLSRRLIYKPSTGSSKRGSRFHAEIWFDTGMIEERLLSINPAGILVHQHDSPYFGLPASYTGEMRRAKRYDSLYHFFPEESMELGPEVKPRPKRKKPVQDRFVPRMRRESITTAKELMESGGSLGDRGKQFL